MISWGNPWIFQGISWNFWGKSQEFQEISFPRKIPGFSRELLGISKEHPRIIWEITATIGKGIILPNLGQTLQAAKSCSVSTATGMLPLCYWLVKPARGYRVQRGGGTGVYAWCNSRCADGVCRRKIWKLGCCAGRQATAEISDQNLRR